LKKSQIKKWDGKNYHPEVNLPVLKGRLLRSARIIPLAPNGGILSAPPTPIYTVVIKRVTGTSQADLTSGPRTRLFSSIGESLEMLNSA